MSASSTFIYWFVLVVRTRPETFHRRMIRSQVEAYGNTTFYDPIRHCLSGVTPVASFLNQIYFMYVSIACLYICAPHECSTWYDQKRAGSPGVPGSFEPPSWCWKLNLLLTTEASLHPLPIAWCQMLYSELLLYFLKVAPVFPEEWQETRELSRARDSHIFMTLLHMLW